MFIQDNRERDFVDAKHFDEIMQSVPVSVVQEEKLRIEEYAWLRSRTRFAFNIVTGVKFDRQCQPALVEETLRRVVQRNTLLRASFHASHDCSPEDRSKSLERWILRGIVGESIYTARIRSKTAVQSCTFERSSYSETDTCEGALLKAQTTCQHAFDYATPPMIRAQLVSSVGRRGEALLIIALPNVIADRYSGRLIAREFVEVYSALANGIDCSLPTVDHEYIDSVATRPGANGGARNNAAADYWISRWSAYAKFQLSPCDMPLLLPICFAAVQGTFPIIRRSAALGLRDITNLSRVAVELKVTARAILTAALAIVVHQLTAKTKFAVWTQLDNRASQSRRTVVGPFAHWHILGFDLASQPDGSAIVEQAQSVLAEALEYEDFPLAALWERCGQYVPTGVRFAVNVIELDEQECGSNKNKDGAITPLTLTHLERPEADCELVIVIERGGVFVHGLFTSKLFQQISADTLLARYTNVLKRLLACRYEKAAAY